MFKMDNFGFRYHGTHSTELGLHVMNITRPLLPPIQTKTMTIPERHGSYYLGYQYEPLELRVEVLFVGQDLFALSSLKRRVAQWLSPEYGLQELIFDDEQDKKYQAVLQGTSDLEQILALGRGELTFLVPDPFAYAVEDDIFTFMELGSHQFERQGTETSFPLIELTGECTPADKLLVSLNDSRIAFSGNLGADDQLVLDSALMTAKIVKADGQVLSAINQLSSLSFPSTKPGENRIELQAAGGANLRRATITCRSRWK